MTVVSTTDFRKNMAHYLERVKMGEYIHIGRRKKSEYTLVPSSLIDDEDLQALQSQHLAQKVAKSRKGKTRSLQEVASSLSIDL